MMKTLVINGSPRKNGDTVSLISEMVSHLHGNVMTVSAYYDNISPCTDCRYCWKNKGCAIHDDMQAIYQAMEESDNIVIASPVFFSLLTGEMMNLASRFQCLYAGKRFRGMPYGGKRKNGALILAGGGDGSAEPARILAEQFFKYANAACIGEVLSLHTDRDPARQDEDAMRKAREIAREMNRLFEAAD